MMTDIESEKIAKFKPNSNIIVTGQSHAGKTTFVFSLLKHMELFESDIKHIIYAYGMWQPLFDQIEREQLILLHLFREYQTKRHYKEFLVNMETFYLYLMM